MGMSKVDKISVMTEISRVAVLEENGGNTESGRGSLSAARVFSCTAYLRFVNFLVRMMDYHF